MCMCMWLLSKISSCFFDNNYTLPVFIYHFQDMMVMVIVNFERTFKVAFKLTVKATNILFLLNITIKRSFDLKCH